MILRLIFHRVLIDFGRVLGDAPTGNMASQWWNKGDNNPPASERSNPSLAWLTESAGIARCGSTGYTTSEIDVSSDASY